MSEIYLLIPIVFAITAATSRSFLELYKNNLSNKRQSTTYFFFISCSSYAFFIFEIKTNPLNHRPYIELFQIIYLIFFIAFFALSLERRAKASPVKILSVSCLGGFVALAAIIVAVALLLVFYGAIGVFQDS
jgi:hypothetical protein